MEIAVVHERPMSDYDADKLVKFDDFIFIAAKRDPTSCAACGYVLNKFNSSLYTIVKNLHGLIIDKVEH